VFSVKLVRRLSEKRHKDSFGQNRLQIRTDFCSLPATLSLSIQRQLLSRVTLMERQILIIKGPFKPRAPTWKKRLADYPLQKSVPALGRIFASLASGNR
jgi:hypothetical protein